MNLDYQILDFVLLSVIFPISLIVSYQDFKYRKIKNKWIKLGLALGLVIYGSAFLFSGAVNLEYIQAVIINSGAAFLVGYLLWYFDLWAAGDAKLFFVISFLLPLRHYQQTVLPVFPSFALLTNIFFPLIIYLIIESAYYLIEKAIEERGNFFQKLDKLKKVIQNDWRELLSSLLLFLFIFFMIHASRLKLMDIVDLGRYQSVATLGMFFFINPIKNILKKRKEFLALLILLSLWVFSGLEGLNLTETLISSMYFMMAFVIIQLFSEAYIARDSEKSHLMFGVWVFIGVIITMLLQGSLFVILIR